MAHPVPDRRIQRQPQIGDIINASFIDQPCGKHRNAVVIAVEHDTVLVAPITNPRCIGDGDWVFDGTPYPFLKSGPTRVKIRCAKRTAISRCWLLRATRPDFIPALDPIDRDRLQKHIALMSEHECGDESCDARTRSVRSFPDYRAAPAA